MLFWNKFCGLAGIFLICSSALHAQQAIADKKFIFKFNEIHAFPALKNNTVQPNIVPQNYYTQHFGIMCKQELAIEKATKIPFRFRLGSLQQCNYLEGKK